MTDRISLVLVDDHPLFRDGVAHTLSLEPDMQVIGQGATADEAVALASQLLPDVLLLDISLPGGGLNAARKIAISSPVVKVLMLTVSEEDDDVLAALKAGARGYTLKGVSARELVQIVRTVHAGETYVTPSLAASVLLEMTRPRTAPVNPLSELTDRERQILEQIAAGQSNKEIGRNLGLTEKTVKHYVTNIFQKLQVRNRVEAALLALGNDSSESR